MIVKLKQIRGTFWGMSIYTPTHSVRLLIRCRVCRILIIKYAVQYNFNNCLVIVCLNIKPHTNFLPGGSWIVLASIHYYSWVLNICFCNIIIWLLGPGFCMLKRCLKWSGSRLAQRRPVVELAHKINIIWSRNTIIVCIIYDHLSDNTANYIYAHIILYQPKFKND